MSDTEKTEHFIKLSLSGGKDEEPYSIFIPIPDHEVENLYNAEVDFDIIRKVTLIEERSITELKSKKEK